MKKRILIVLALCAVIAFVTAFLLSRSEHEPHYESRPLTAWVNDLRRGTSEQKARATEVLRLMGPEAAAYLAASLGKKPGIAQRLKDAVGPRIPETLKRPVRRFFDPAQQIMDKYSMAETLRVIGTNGQAAVPMLGELLTDGNALLSITASRALAQMGPEAVAPLTAALDHQDFNVRAAACDGLGHLGPVAASAAPRLARIIESEIGPIVGTAAFTLSKLGEASVPVLVPLLKNTNWVVRRHAAFSLAYAGWAAKKAEPALLEAAHDPHPQVRAMVIDALGRIDPISRAGVADADAALDDPDASTRGSALQMLRYRPRFVRENPQRIIALLDDPSPDVRGHAALAISAAPAQASNAIPRLENLALETNKVVQASAIQALKIIRETPAN